MATWLGAFVFSFLALAAITLGARRAGANPLGRGLIAAVGAGVLVGGAFALINESYGGGASPVWGPIFAGGILGALPTSIYFGLGHALRARPDFSLIGAWMASLALVLPYCFFFGLVSAIHTSCGFGSDISCFT